MKPKRSILKSRWFWVLILILIVFSLVLYFSLFYSGVQVENIEISGNQKVASEDIRSLVSENIYNKFLSVGEPFGSWGVGSKSIFLVKPDDLERKILSGFSEIESVKISRKFFQTVEVSTTERASVAAFCPLVGETGCYLIDANGIIFEPALGIPQGIFIVRQTASLSEIFKGETVIDKNIINSILKIEKNLKDNFQIDVKEALVRSLMRLDVNTNENWKIYFDITSDVDLQITKLNLLLGSEISSEQRNNLRYINLIPKSKAIICDNDTCGGN